MLNIHLGLSRNGACCLQQLDAVFVFLGVLEGQVERVQSAALIFAVDLFQYKLFQRLRWYLFLH